MITTRHERQLIELKIRYPEQAEKMIEWAKKKGTTTVHSFWDWLEEAGQRIAAGKELD